MLENVLFVTIGNDREGVANNMRCICYLSSTAFILPLLTRKMQNQILTKL